MALIAIVTGADDPPVAKEQKGARVTGAEPYQLPVPKGDSPAAKGYAGIITATNVKLKTAKDEDINRLLSAMAEEIVALAPKYPTDEITLSQLIQAIGYTFISPDAAKTRAAATALIKAHFAKSPAIQKEMRNISVSFDDGCADIVREVFKSHPDKLIRAHAAKALIKGLKERESIAESAAKDKENRKMMESQVGKDALQKLIDSVPATKKEADDYRAALQGELKGLVPDLTVGSMAPESVCVNLDGKAVKLSELKGKVVVLDFWFTSCGPCKALIPHTRELVKKNDGRPFVFVNISVDEEKENLTKFMAKTPMPWTHWWDGKNELSGFWEVEAYPTLYVIDHKGIIRFKTVGLDPEDSDFDATIEKLVKAAEAGK
jgi:thiol-disulfide isomerase/thioredoxin